MTRFATAAVLALASAHLLTADDKTTKELEGTYRAVDMKKDGKDVPDDLVRGTTVTVAGDEITFTIRLKEKDQQKVTIHPAKIKVDAAAKPATIDISPSDGPEKGKTFPGIYKFEQGDLVLAFAEKGDRPTDFKGGGEVLLVRLKRDEKK